MVGSEQWAHMCFRTGCPFSLGGGEKDGILKTSLPSPCMISAQGAMEDKMENSCSDLCLLKTSC